MESIRSLFDGRPIEILYHQCSNGEVYVSDAIAIDAGQKVRDREYRSMIRAIARHEKEVSVIAGREIRKLMGANVHAY
jgi:hypothetical protein